MNLSFWERKSWFTDVDYTIVGSGIVGLNAALRLRERFPNSKILIIEKGMLPQGASTKNAGFACFGSLSEIVDDLKVHTEQQVLNLIAKRWAGLQMLRNRLGDAVIDFRNYGGYELFPDDDRQTYDECISKIGYINEMLRPMFQADVFRDVADPFNFNGIRKELIFNSFEAQIDTGKMMQALLKLAVANDILILNNQSVTAHHQKSDSVTIALGDFTFDTQNLLYATNGFAQSLTHDEVQPARAQVLITKPIPDLAVKGTFHIDKGYYYFRNIGNRILFGGGRNLDFVTETTTEFGQTQLIQDRLEQMLREIILPGQAFEIDHRWSGIMGMGSGKYPIVRQLSENVYCGVRLGGMGVAIGSLIGTELAELIN